MRLDAYKFRKLVSVYAFGMLIEHAQICLVSIASFSGVSVETKGLDPKRLA